MFKVLLSLLVLVTLLFAQVGLAQDDSMMMDDSMKDAMMAGEFTAVISMGRARIRSEASMEGETLGYCLEGDQLTVWLPALGDWLTSSCQEVNGFIHSSLVDVGEKVVPAEDAMMEDGMMDDGMKKDAMMEDGMKKDAMMDDGMMADKMMDDSMKDAMMAGEFTAVISRGRARIRSEASMEGETLGHCLEGDQLTVWLPGEGEWLMSSCHNVNGYIHSSLVEVGQHVIPSISDLGGSDQMAIKDDMSMDEM